jgi:hypothetical protein
LAYLFVALEEKAAKEGIVYTETQLIAIDPAKRQRETDPEEIETAHPGYRWCYQKAFSEIVKKTWPLQKR